MKFDRNFSSNSIVRQWLTCTALMVLTACGQISIDNVCSTHPELCNDLNDDGWCKAERDKIIRHRYEHLQVPENGEQKYYHMLYLEEYRDCISQAAQIRHVRQREKESNRMRGLLTAERELSRLQKETKNIDNPYLLYYHWSRFGDTKAMERVMEYQQNKQLEEPDLQVAIASYYVKFNLPMARDTLYHALELYESGDEVDTEIFASLSAIHLQLDATDQSYVWGFIARENEVKNVDLGGIEVLATSQGYNIDDLQDTAHTYMDDINDGDFVSPSG